MSPRLERVAQYNELTESINELDYVVKPSGPADSETTRQMLVNQRERIWNSSTDEEKRLMDPNWGKVWYRGQDPQTGNTVTWLDYDMGGAS